jgi:hypothetical protein
MSPGSKKLRQASTQPAVPVNSVIPRRIISWIVAAWYWPERMERRLSIATTRPRYGPGIESLLRSALEETCACAAASLVFDATPAPAAAAPPIIFKHCLRVTDMMDDPPNALHRIRNRFGVQDCLCWIFLMLPQR